MLRCLEVVFRTLPESCVAVSSICALHSLTSVQLRLMTILGNRGFDAVASFFGVPSAFHGWKPTNATSPERLAALCLARPLIVYGA
jgi:hypothetical protein